LEEKVKFYQIHPILKNKIYLQKNTQGELNTTSLQTDDTYFSIKKLEKSKNEYELYDNKLKLISQKGKAFVIKIEATKDKDIFKISGTSLNGKYLGLSKEGNIKLCKNEKGEESSWRMTKTIIKINENENESLLEKNKMVETIEITKEKVENKSKENKEEEVVEKEIKKEATEKEIKKEVTEKKEMKKVKEIKKETKKPKFKNMMEELKYMQELKIKEDEKRRKEEEKMRINEENKKKKEEEEEKKKKKVEEKEKKKSKNYEEEKKKEEEEKKKEEEKKRKKEEEEKKKEEEKKRKEEEKKRIKIPEEEKEKKKSKNLEGETEETKKKIEEELKKQDKKIILIDLIKRNKEFLFLRSLRLKNMSATIGKNENFDSFANFEIPEYKSYYLTEEGIISIENIYYLKESNTITETEFLNKKNEILKNFQKIENENIDEKKNSLKIDISYNDDYDSFYFENNSMNNIKNNENNSVKNDSEMNENKIHEKIKNNQNDDYDSFYFENNNKNNNQNEISNLILENNNNNNIENNDKNIKSMNKLNMNDSFYFQNSETIHINEKNKTENDENEIKNENKNIEQNKLFNIFNLFKVFNDKNNTPEKIIHESNDESKIDSKVESKVESKINENLGNEDIISKNNENNESILKKKKKKNLIILKRDEDENDIYFPTLKNILLNSFNNRFLFIDDESGQLVLSDHLIQDNIFTIKRLEDDHNVYSFQNIFNKNLKIDNVDSKIMIKRFTSPKDGFSLFDLNTKKYLGF
jgi:hypothetical protein